MPEENSNKCFFLFLFKTGKPDYHIKIQCIKRIHIRCTKCIQNRLIKQIININWANSYDLTYCLGMLKP